MTTEKVVKDQRYALQMQPYISNVFVAYLFLFEKEIAHVRQLRIHQYVYLCICQCSFMESQNICKG